MIIRKLHIVGFGKFSDFDLDLRNDLQVVYGENESGKSTLRQFISGVLFGFTQNKRQASNLYEPHNGAQYGGSLLLEKDQRLWEISRLGRTQSRLSVKAPNGVESPNPEDQLKQLLAPFTEDSFQDIFSFDQEQLNEIRNLSGKDLSNRLLSFSAVNADRWQELSAALDKSASDRFGVTKTAKRPINRLIKDFEDLDTQIDAMTGQLSQYRQAEENKDRLVHQLEEVESQQKKLQIQIGQFTKLADLSDLYAEKNELAAGSSDLEAFSDAQITALTDSTAAQVEKLEGQINGIDLDEGSDHSTEISENPLLTIYKNNQRDLDLLDQSIPNLIAGNNLFDQTKNELKVLSSRLDQLHADLKVKFNDPIPKPLPQGLNIQPKTKISAFFIIGIILAVAGVLGIVYGFLSLEFPLPFFICGAGGLIIGGLLAFFERPKKESIDLSGYGYGTQTDLALITASQRELQEYDEKVQNFNQLVKQKQGQLYKIDSLLKLAMPLKQYLPDSAQSHDTLVGQIQVLLNEIRDEKRSAALSAEQKRLVEDNRQQQQNHLNDLKNQQRQIFDSLKVTDYSEFQKLLAARSSAQQRQDHLQNIEQVLTTDKEAMINQLGGIDQIILKIQAAKAQLTNLDAKIQDVNGQLLTVQSQLMSLSGDRDYQDKLQQRADLETEINNELEGYFTNRLAASWINESLYEISHERMPEIKKQAEAYFSELTDGKYREIIFQDHALLVTNGQGDHFYAYELSKGSSEQLYVALRLAFAESLAVKNPLPFLIDDSFVNFDASRKDVMDRILNHLAEKYQVIYFTANHDQNFMETNIIDLGALANA
ncbi:ATP-binding protein [Oenococcus kitaharae]|uniref:DNA double-strand break repair rad50 ATPase n=1 Tax=Oenococcus kitaharae DSM 17330 TaxID=1045004 RepID=G9WG47_9LACO|nr:AAA family ATPase [Oenococcus kitaharae]EHN59625.1 DNA double-strand break repair rad50 ATPase [Oenococcus kitaharae DSM 17330]OEY83469.1 DNA repair protein [Oenococcus kitaharae]OEY85268.1 DNA repair protein [Oenococcus kitaharae]OEY86122.1 DNA repair protein [Oenococcus kitaharae]